MRRGRVKMIRPLDDRVVIEPMEAEEKTAGGILLPDTAKEKPMKGKIIAVGEGKMLESGKRAELLVKKGDKVLYGKYAGTEVAVDGKEYLVMRESDILAKIE
ncbi:MAG: co-chaperone GroES [Candidatus Brocadia sp.]|nr:co-chaperone GroES [Candidatus Brocadia sp. AMX3]RIK02282.1 MAG: co-chaperone GroES [Candidatus Brocadia sp.]